MAMLDYLDERNKDSKPFVTVRFEKIHGETYRDFGFELVSVEPRSLVQRVSMIKAAIR
jgi:predicted ATPase